MNPLSALRTLAYPALRADPIRPPAETAAPTPIPFTELEKISPGIQGFPTGGELGLVGTDDGAAGRTQTHSSPAPPPPRRTGPVPASLLPNL